jgi:hypothetical protein
LALNRLFREPVSHAELWLREQLKKMAGVGVVGVPIRKRESAVALFEREMPKKARRQLWCGATTSTANLGACGLRECEDCAELRGRRSFERQKALVSTYSSKQAVLYTYASDSLFTLTSDLEQFKRLQRRQRERQAFASVCSAGTLTFEVPLTRDQRTFNAHAHGILAVNLDGEALRAWVVGQAEVWRVLTERPGSLFDVEPLRNARQLLEYGLKLGREDKSYATGQLPPWAAAHVEKALHRKRLILSWGSWSGAIGSSTNNSRGGR